LGISLGNGFVLPSLAGMLVDTAAGQQKGKLTGLWNFSLDTGFVLGPLMGGIIGQFFGIRAIFTFFGVVFLVIVALFLLLRKRDSG